MTADDIARVEQRAKIAAIQMLMFGPVAPAIIAAPYVRAPAVKGGKIILKSAAGLDPFAPTNPVMTVAAVTLALGLAAGAVWFFAPKVKREVHNYRFGVP